MESEFHESRINFENIGYDYLRNQLSKMTTQKINWEFIFDKNCNGKP